MLLALTILGGLVATSLTLGTIVVTQLQSVRIADRLVLASYAAESGVEEALYQIRKVGNRSALDVQQRPLVSGATWTRSTQVAANEVYLNIPRDTVEQLDLFDPSGTFRAVGVRALRITAPAVQSGAWLEVRWVPWLDTGEWAPSVGRRLFSPAELQSDQVVDLSVIPTGGNTVAYRVRFRAFAGDVGRIRIRATSDPIGQVVVPFPAKVQARVVGTMGDARYAVQVEVPSQLPLAPVFDYVLFSECDIVKGDTVRCP